MEGIDPERLASIEQKVSKDKLRKYLGTAQFMIKDLTFLSPCRQPDSKIIDQLKRDFEGEGCLRDRLCNRIPALISESMFNAVLEELSTTAEAFRATSTANLKLVLNSNVKPECLHRLHRVLAAKAFLPPIHQWWVVDLYSNNTIDAFREGYSYSAPYASGDIFRHMRLCHFENDLVREQRWRSRLSEPQEKYVKIILQKGILIGALDSVLDIQGLWRSFYIGSLNDFISVGFEEEIKNAINRVGRMWRFFCLNDNAVVRNLDPYTVHSLQCRAPALSRSDFEFVQEGMKDELFSGVKDPGQRAKITELLLTSSELIPSLWTVLSDIRYMKQPAKILKTLLPPKPRKSKKERSKTLRQRFLYHFTASGRETIQLQRTPATYTSIPASHIDLFNASYQQLWFCAYRVSKDINAYGSLQLATLAHHLGFSSKEIEKELPRDAGNALVKKCVVDALKVLRPGEVFVLNEQDIGAVVLPFNDCLNKILQAAWRPTRPCITVSGPGEPLHRRCGYGSSDNEDLHHLFLEIVHAPLQEYQNNGNEISSFYVKRSRHLAFFENLSLNGAHRPDPTEQNVASSVVDPVEQQPLRMTPAVGRGSPQAIPTEQDQSSNGGMQMTIFHERIVRFIYNDVIVGEVPFDRESVLEQARQFANQEKVLSLVQGGVIFWRNCFLVLQNSGDSIILVSDPTEPSSILGKRPRQVPADGEVNDNNRSMIAR